jgi:acetolactate synthase small subunit
MGTPSSSDSHTFSLVVQDKPGVLVRIALVFARRGFNIESLAVSPGAIGGFARMTIVSRGDPEVLEQIIKQLAKLIDVVFVTDHGQNEAIEQEVALVKLRCDGSVRERVLALADEHRAQLVDTTEGTMVFAGVGTPGEIDALVAALGGAAVEELVRSGPIVMDRGGSQFAHLLRPVR